MPHHETQPSTTLDYINELMTALNKARYGVSPAARRGALRSVHERMLTVNPTPDATIDRPEIVRVINAISRLAEAALEQVGDARLRGPMRNIVLNWQQYAVGRARGF